MHAFGGAWPGGGPEWGRFRPQNHARMVPSWLTRLRVYDHQKASSAGLRFLSQADGLYSSGIYSSGVFQDAETYYKNSLGLKTRRIGILGLQQYSGKDSQ